MMSTSRTRLGLLVAAAFVAGACSAPEAEESTSAAMATVLEHLKGETVAIVPFDSKNVACVADPGVMSQATAAACAHLDPQKEYEFTKDPTRFVPRDSPLTILVVKGRAVDAAHPDVRWHAIVPMGPAASVGGAALTQSIRPRSTSLIVGGSESLLSGKRAVPWLGGEAVVAAPGLSPTEQQATAEEDGALIKGRVNLLASQPEIALTVDAIPLAELGSHTLVNEFASLSPDESGVAVASLAPHFDNESTGTAKQAVVVAIPYVVVGVMGLYALVVGGGAQNAAQNATQTAKRIHFTAEDRAFSMGGSKGLLSAIVQASVAPTLTILNGTAMTDREAKIQALKDFLATLDLSEVEIVDTRRYKKDDPCRDAAEPPAAVSEPDRFETINTIPYRVFDIFLCKDRFGALTLRDPLGRSFSPTPRTYPHSMRQMFINKVPNAGMILVFNGSQGVGYYPKPSVCKIRDGNTFVCTEVDERFRNFDGVAGRSGGDTSLRVEEK